ncbi:hypothetical protein HanOQP8_Chr00c004g0684271 [Helianthus annuus]|nr:hypothetical protein HanOQP8_Chr00c004g0684271 [Helianthus annuus]
MVICTALRMWVGGDGGCGGAVVTVRWMGFQVRWWLWVMVICTAIRWWVGGDGGCGGDVECN